jgi:methionyl-tRNA formyltransferase
MIDDLRIKLGPVEIEADAPESLPPGVIHVDRKSVWIGTSSEPVRLGQIQPPGKKLMNAVDWARGARLDAAARAS